MQGIDASHTGTISDEFCPSGKSVGSSTVRNWWMYDYNCSAPSLNFIKPNYFVSKGEQFMLQNFESYFFFGEFWYRIKQKQQFKIKMKKVGAM